MKKHVFSLRTYTKGKVKIGVIYEDETLWLSQKMAELFDVSVEIIGIPLILRQAQHERYANYFTQ